MPLSDENVFEDQYLVRYLVGALPEEEADRLDQLSIADDDFAWRLREVENDLVDSYVRSELDDETHAGFKAFYMATAARRQKVQFAEGLRQFEATNARAERAAKFSKSRAPLWGLFPRSLIAPQVAMSFAALAMFLIAGYLLVQNAQLRREISDGRAQYQSVDQRARNLESQLQQRADDAQAQKPATADASQLKVVSLLLPPPSRGLSSLKTVTVQPHTDLVVLLLTLESADFSKYHVTLKDPATNRELWRSTELEPASAGEKSVVSVNFPANLLRQQNYIAEVSGLRHGGTEIIGDYPFHAALK
jgi:hypothetical protein